MFIVHDEINKKKPSYLLAGKTHFFKLHFSASRHCFSDILIGLLTVPLSIPKTAKGEKYK